MSKIRPIGDRLLIKQHSAEETYTNTNIYIPESNQTKEDRGTVVGIGDEVKGVFEGEVEGGIREDWANFPRGKTDGPRSSDSRRLS